VDKATLTDYILSQADYFIVKKSADNETAKIFAGLIEKISTNN